MHDFHSRIVLFFNVLAKNDIVPFFQFSGWGGGGGRGQNQTFLIKTGNAKVCPKA